MQRRHALVATLSSTLSMGLASRVWAAPARAAADTRFLLVFQRGACDALSLLVPRANAFVRELRPQIAITDTDRAALDAHWALHPVLAPTLGSLAQRGQLVCVPYAGEPGASRSHFEVQDQIERGQGDRASARDFDSGFLNRLAQQLGATGAPARALGFTAQLPLALRGRAPAANVSLKGAPGRAGANSAALKDPLLAMYQGTELQAPVAEAFALREAVSQELQAEMVAADRGALGSRSFESEARRLALMLRERCTLGFVDVGGWDTHVNQGADSGALATRLDALGRGLLALADAMGEPAWRRTVVVVMSEFGRTVKENGNRGTDHGHGGAMLVLGGGLAAGAPVRGEQVALNAAALYQQRDLPVHNDWRGLMGGLFARQFGLGRAALAEVFPGAAARDLALL